LGTLAISEAPVKNISFLVAPIEILTPKVPSAIEAATTEHVFIETSQVR